MATVILDQNAIGRLADHFSALVETVPLWPIATEAQYDEAVSVMDGLLDAGAADENHPLAGLLATLAQFIQAYDVDHRLDELSPADAFGELLASRGLTPADVPEVGDPVQVARILAGQEALTLEAMRALSRRFGISASVFL